MEPHFTPCPTLKSTNDKFEYFIERTEKDLEEINKKLDQLMEFRWLIIGASMSVSAFVSTIIALLSLHNG